MFLLLRDRQFLAARARYTTASCAPRVRGVYPAQSVTYLVRDRSHLPLTRCRRPQAQSVTYLTSGTVSHLVSHLPDVRPRQSGTAGCVWVSGLRQPTASGSLRVSYGRLRLGYGRFGLRVTQALWPHAAALASRLWPHAALRAGPEAPHTQQVSRQTGNAGYSASRIKLSWSASEAGEKDGTDALRT